MSASEAFIPSRGLDLAATPARSRRRVPGSISRYPLDEEVASCKWHCDHVAVLGRMYPKENCSAARALELVGERWSLLIVRNAVFGGMTRFAEFQTQLGIATNVLAARLEGFVTAGLMHHRSAEDGSGREYVLTEKGRELAVVVIALTEWGDRWAAPDGPPILMRHDSCGGTVCVSVECTRCGQPPTSTEIVAVPGPGVTPEPRASESASDKEIRWQSSS